MSRESALAEVYNRGPTALGFTFCAFNLVTLLRQVGEDAAADILRDNPIALASLSESGRYVRRLQPRKSVGVCSENEADA